MRIVQVATDTEVGLIGCGLPGPAERAADRPDESWTVKGRDGDVAGFCSLWWRETPVIAGRPVGAIGHLAVTGRDAAVALLRHAAARLRAAGRHLAVAPLDGTTWRRYRLVTDTSPRPPFLMEPATPIDWLHHLAAAGFDPLFRYWSGIDGNLDVPDERADAWGDGLADRGLTVRPFALDRLDGELAGIHGLTLEAFADAALFRPVERDRFVTRYRRLLPLMQPAFTLIAEADGHAAGYLLAYPDLAQARRGDPVDTLVLKTIAVRRGRRFAGLGRYLAHRVRRSAAAAGYRYVIHALMREGGISTAWSRRRGSVLRRYAVCARRLA